MPTFSGIKLKYEYEGRITRARSCPCRSSSSEKTSCTTLLTLDCVPRKCYAEGRFGSRIYKILEEQKEMHAIDRNDDISGGKKKEKIGDINM